MGVLAAAAAVVATVLAFLSLIPQMLKLRRTGSAEGVSAAWAAFGAVTNGAWTVYLVAQSLWLAVPSTAVVTVFYLTTLALIVGTGRNASLPLRLGAIWASVLIVSGATGGWEALGVVLGLSYAVQAAPSIWAAFRTATPRGIAPGTWGMALVEAVLWGYYGWFHRDVAIILFAVLATATAALILVRYLATRHRFAPAG
jgi:uncharacterized protein with PQ loop repeat